MSKIGLIAFAAAVLFTGIGYAADKITLTCSGTRRDLVTNGENPFNTSLVIDLDKGVMTGDLGSCAFPSCSFSFTEVTEHHIVLKAKNNHVGGNINRITGSLYVTDAPDGYRTTIVYEATCKPAKPLF